MDAYRHFGLRASPFEGRPDPTFFFPAAGHAEAVAAARYAVHAMKSCVAVVGESGLGKTLVARCVAERVNRATGILWINGIGQPKAQTETSYYEPGTLVGVGRFRARPVEALLASWVRSNQAWTGSTLVIVDNADALREHAWSDLLSLVTREFEAGRRATVALFGLPRLLDQLSAPRLQRMQRRVFRLARLRSFSAADSESYVAHRLALCGRTEPLFSVDALAAIHDAAGGNPALINQICDNALVESFGESLATIDVEQIEAAVRAMSGGALAPRRRATRRNGVGRPAPRRVVHAARVAKAALEQIDHSPLGTLLKKSGEGESQTPPAEELLLTPTCLETPATDAAPETEAPRDALCEPFELDVTSAPESSDDAVLTDPAPEPLCLRLDETAADASEDVAAESDAGASDWEPTLEEIRPEAPDDDQSQEDASPATDQADFRAMLEPADGDDVTIDQNTPAHVVPSLSLRDEPRNGTAPASLRLTECNVEALTAMDHSTNAPIARKPSGTSSVVDERLRLVASRITSALARVRDAGQQFARTGPAAGDSQAAEKPADAVIHSE